MFLKVIFCSAKVDQDYSVQFYESLFQPINSTGGTLAISQINVLKRSIT